MLSVFVNENVQSRIFQWVGVTANDRDRAMMRKKHKIKINCKNCVLTVALLVGRLLWQLFSSQQVYKKYRKWRGTKWGLQNMTLQQKMGDHQTNVPPFFWKENQIVHQQISIAQMHCLGKLVWCSTSWFNPMVRSWNRAKCDKHRASNSVIKKTFRTIFLQSQQLLSLSHSIVTCVPIARRFSHQWPSVNIIPYPGRKSELSTDRDVFFSPVFLWQWVRRK